MPDKKTKQPAAEHPRPKNIVVAGRVIERKGGRIQLELADGLTVDVAEEDCASIHEATHPTTHRPAMTLTLKGEKPLSAIFQPHLYRVLAEQKTTPFAFVKAATVAPDQFRIPVGHAVDKQRVDNGGGGGSGYDHITTMMTSSWYGDQQDGFKPDDAGEPGTIYLP